MKCLTIKVAQGYSLYCDCKKQQQKITADNWRSLMKKYSSRRTESEESGVNLNCKVGEYLLVKHTI